MSAQRVVIHKVQYRDPRGRFVCTPGKACKTKSRAKRKPCKRKPSGAYIEVRERKTAFAGPRLEYYYHDPELERHEREARKRRDYQTLRQIRELKGRILRDLIEHYEQQQSGADIDNPHDAERAMKQHEIEARAKRGAEGRLRYLERVAHIEGVLSKQSDEEVRRAGREAAARWDKATLAAVRRVMKARGYNQAEIDMVAPKVKPKKTRGRRRKRANA